MFDSGRYQMDRRLLCYNFIPIIVLIDYIFMQSSQQNAQLFIPFDRSFCIDLQFDKSIFTLIIHIYIEFDEHSTYGVCVQKNVNSMSTVNVFKRWFPSFNTFGNFVINTSYNIKIYHNFGDEQNVEIQFREHPIYSYPIKVKICFCYSFEFVELFTMCRNFVCMRVLIRKKETQKRRTKQIDWM